MNSDTAVIVPAYCGSNTIEGEKQKRLMTKTLCKSLYEAGHFVVLASHSTIDIETQNYCHLFVYDCDNSFSVDGIPERNRPHSVAELTSIHNALKLLPKRIKYVLKVCYDNQPDFDFADVIQKAKNTGKKLVTGKWGNDITLGVHLCFFDIDFFHETLSFDELPRYDSQPNLEHVWYSSVRDKGLLDQVHGSEMYDRPPYFFGHEVKQYSNDGGTRLVDYPYG
jgi:hypothetical protein